MIDRMLERIKSSWERFKEEPPGRRFEDWYHERRRQSGGRLDAAKVVHILGGAATVIVGLILVPLPGPGWGIVFLGLALIGSECLPIARFLDRVEVRLRSWAGQLLAAWRRATVRVKVLITLVALICMAAAGYGTYHLTFGVLKVHTWVKRG